MKKEKRLITAALPYTNNIPHIGNIVGSHLPADIFARYCRLNNYDVVFVGGADDHGTPITLEAKRLGITPKQLSDSFYKIHKRIYDWFNFSYNNFSRTSKKIHHKTTQEFFKKIYDKGFIIEKEIELPYCLKCKMELPDRYINGECPYCGYKNARGDQCENCSRLLDPIQLKNPRCAICKSSDIKFKKFKHLFFDLSKLSDKLKKWIENNKHWRKNVRNLALGWIKSGLKERCISRDLDWGVKVPIKGYENLVFYVWAEAAIGYISATREWNKKRWKDYWQKKDSKIYHFIGKDNIPFHTILFPAELMANGDYNLPYNVVGLQYLNYEGGKFSKSLGHGVFCENLLDLGLDVDYWRFYLTFLIPETGDTDFIWKEFREKIDSELIGNLSNFIHRTLSIVFNYLDGKVSKPKKFLESNKKFIKIVEKNCKEISKLLESVELRMAIRQILNLSAEGNKYFNDNEPWKLVKENKKEANKVLYLCVDLCRTLAILIDPFLPGTAEKIWKQLNLKGSIDKKGIWKTVTKIDTPSYKIKKPKILFRKLLDTDIEVIKERASKTKTEIKWKR